MKKIGKPISSVQLGTDFPKRLRQLRLSVKPISTQAETALLLGLSRGFYCGLEAGSVAALSPDRLIRINTLFNVSDDDLLEPDEAPLQPRKHDCEWNRSAHKNRLMNVGRGFPHRLNSLRLTLNLTQQEFSELIGRSYCTINRLERGRVLPSEETFYAIIEATGKSDLWLYGGAHEKKLRDLIRHKRG